MADGDERTGNSKGVRFQWGGNWPAVPIGGSTHEARSDGPGERIAKDIEQMSLETLTRRPGKGAGGGARSQPVTAAGGRHLDSEGKCASSGERLNPDRNGSYASSSATAEFARPPRVGLVKVPRTCGPRSTPPLEDRVGSRTRSARVDPSPARPRQAWRAQRVGPLRERTNDWGSPAVADGRGRTSPRPALLGEHEPVAAGRYEALQLLAALARDLDDHAR